MEHLLYRLFHLDPHNTDHRNAYCLVVELFWASILGSAATFNAAFALRLGASNADIGWLNSLPALLAVLISIPAGRFLQARTRRKPWILWSLFLHRLGFLLVAVIPWLQGLHLPLGSLAVAIFILIGMPAHFFNVGWIPLIAEVVPEQKRASVVTARMMVNNGTVALFNFLFGQGLSLIAFPVNYLLLYTIGFLASMVSMVYLIQMPVPDSAPPHPVAQEKLGWKQSLSQLRRAMSEHRGLTRIIVNTTLHGLGLWLASPLYILYYVRILDASESWIGLQGTVSTLTIILATPLWRKLMERWGKPNTLKRTIILIGLLPIGVALLPDLTLILLVIAAYSLIVPGVNLSHFTTLLEVTPEENRPGYTAWYISVVNIGAFVCPLIGVVLADHFGLRPVIFACGLLSCLGSFSFWLWPVQEEGMRPAGAVVS